MPDHPLDHTAREQTERAQRSRARLIGIAGPTIWLLFVAFALQVVPMALGKHAIMLPVLHCLPAFVIVGWLGLPLWRRAVRRATNRLVFVGLGLARSSFYAGLLALALLIHALLMAADGGDLTRCVTRALGEWRSSMRFLMTPPGILTVILLLGFLDVHWIRSLEGATDRGAGVALPRATRASTWRRVSFLLAAFAWGSAWSLVLFVAGGFCFGFRSPESIPRFALEHIELVLLGFGCASIATWAILWRCGEPGQPLGSLVGWGIGAQALRWTMGLGFAMERYALAIEPLLAAGSPLLSIGSWLALEFMFLGALVVEPLAVFVFVALLLALGAIEMALFRWFLRAPRERSAAPP